MKAVRLAMMVLALSITLPTLAACVPPPSADTQVLCPTPKEYSREWQSQLGMELAVLRKAQPDSAIGEAIVDYERERDKLRACNAANAKKPG